MDTKETTLDEFRRAVEKHAIDGKGGVTLCYRGLPDADKFQARALVRAQRDIEQRLMAAAQVHLRSLSANQHRAKRDMWQELYDRLYTIK
jgi:hypothetical protein